MERPPRRAQPPRQSGAIARRIRLSAFVAVGCLATWLVVCTSVVMFPAEDHPRHADAIVVLGGRGGNAVIDAGLALAREGVSGRVVISDAFGGNTRPARLCETTTDLDVVCFTPNPTDTGGEAIAVSAMAAAHGWDSVLVITSRYHVARARMIFDRCVAGSVSVTAVDTTMGPADWAYQYLYQSGAFIKSLVDPPC